jgi:flagellar hook-length control protein FliK
MQIKKGLLQSQARVSATINQQSLLEQIIATLFKDAESSLARVQLHQLTSQTQETDTKQAWMMELPVRNGNETDVFHLHIEREANKNGSGDPENKSAWTIRLSFTLEELGQIHARISLAGEQVSTTFWLEKQQTTTLFRRHLNELQDNLTRAGISIEQLNILNGSPPETEGALFPQQLLHEKA